MKHIVYISNIDIRDSIYKEYGINKDDILKNKYGKPYLKDSNIYFSISHTEGYFVMAVGDRECGIDIEKDRELDYRKISKMMFDEEIDNKATFLKRWVKHEAKTKLMGLSMFSSEVKSEEGIKYTNIDIIDNVYISLATFDDTEVEVRIC